jgi:hypothetical protein
MVKGEREKVKGKGFKDDGPGKSKRRFIFVIPAKAGIQG